MFDEEIGEILKMKLNLGKDKQNKQDRRNLYERLDEETNFIFGELTESLELQNKMITKVVKFFSAREVEYDREVKYLRRKLDNYDISLKDIEELKEENKRLKDKLSRKRPSRQHKNENLNKNKR